MPSLWSRPLAATDGHAGAAGGDRQAVRRSAPRSHPPRPASRPTVPPSNALNNPGYRVTGSRQAAFGSGFRVQGSGFRVQGSAAAVPRGAALPQPSSSSTAGCAQQWCCSQGSDQLVPSCGVGLSLVCLSGQSMQQTWTVPQRDGPPNHLGVVLLFQGRTSWCCQWSSSSTPTPATTA